MAKHIILLSLFAFTIPPLFAQADFSNRVLTLKTTRYDLDVRVDYEDRKLFSACRLTVSNPTEEAVDHVPLLLYRLLRITSVRDPGRNALSFTQQVLSFEDWEALQINYVEIYPETPIAPGEEQTLVLEYEGFLFGYTETGMRYVQDRIDPEFTIIRPDSWGYPVVGYPSWKINRAAGLPAFAYRLHVTVPDSFVVANGGKLINRKRDDEHVTYTYENIKPAWRIDIAIADYRVREAGSNRVFYFPEDEEGAARVMDALQTTLDLYTEWFGPLQEYQGYTVVEIPDGWGSQADVTSIIQTAAAFKEAERTLEVYHEISHLWNVEEKEALPPRWNEGLASFLQYLTVEKVEGRAVLDDALEHTTARLREAVQNRPHYQHIPLIDFGQEEVTGLSYRLGMVLFAVFYELVGEAQFNAIIGSFYQTYYASGATTDDFVNHAKHVSPVDLTRFFEDWIYGTESWTHIQNRASVDQIVQEYRAK